MICTCCNVREGEAKYFFSNVYCDECRNLKGGKCCSDWVAGLVENSRNTIIAMTASPTTPNVHTVTWNIQRKTPAPAPASPDILFIPIPERENDCCD